MLPARELDRNHAVAVGPPGRYNNTHAPIKQYPARRQRERGVNLTQDNIEQYATIAANGPTRGGNIVGAVGGKAMAQAG